VKLNLNMQWKWKSTLIIFIRGVLILLPIMAVLFTGGILESGQESIKAQSLDSTINSIKNITIDKQTISISADRPFKYSINKLADPFKIEIELKSVELGRFTERMISADSIANEIVFSTKMVPDQASILEVTLSSPQKFENSIVENNLIIKFNSDEDSSEGEKSKDEIGSLLTAQGTKEDGHVEETVMEPQKPATTITDIKFKRELEYVKLIIKGNGSMLPDVFKLDNKVVIDIPRVTITAKMPKQVPIPIESIKWGDNDGKIRMIIALKEQAAFDVIAYGEEIIVSLTSPEIVKKGKDVISASNLTTIEAGGNEADTVKGEQKIYSGKKISLDIQNADIAPILRLFADISGKNVIIDPKVTGKINMKLVNVPWDQALELILRTNGLSQVSEGNIIRIANADDLVKEQKQADNLTSTKPLSTKLFPVNYKAIADMLKAIKEADLLSPKGKISEDDRAQVLIVNDVEDTFPKIQRLIDLLDTPDLQIKQVLIEARLVEVDTNYTKKLGINWNYKNSSPNNGNVNAAGNPLHNLSWNSGVNLPTGNQTTFGIGYMPSAGFEVLNATLDAYEEDNKSRTISSPRILTMNNTAATISQGQTIYMQSLSPTGSATVTAINALLSLKVTPSISPGGTVHLMIDITNNDYQGDQAGKPVINTNTLTTETSVISGDTVVIGGIYYKQNTRTNESVPLLSQIPIIGWFFKNDSQSKKSRELMVFITPRIVSRIALGDISK